MNSLVITFMLKIKYLFLLYEVLNCFYTFNVVFYFRWTFNFYTPISTWLTCNLEVLFYEFYSSYIILVQICF